MKSLNYLFRFVFISFIILILNSACTADVTYQNCDIFNNVDIPFPTNEDSEYTILIDSSFTDVQKDIILIAGLRWREKLIDVANIKFEYASNLNLNQQNSYIKVTNIPAPPGSIGYCDWVVKSDNTTKSAVIRINNDLSNDLFYAVILHEFGHSFGLEHYTSDDHPSIMEPYVSNVYSIQCIDEKKLCENWGCVSYCKL